MTLAARSRVLRLASFMSSLGFQSLAGAQISLFGQARHVPPPPAVVKIMRKPLP
jgi:hypothetical protein